MILIALVVNHIRLAYFGTQNPIIIKYAVERAIRVRSALLEMHDMSTDLRVGKHLPTSHSVTER